MNPPQAKPTLELNYRAPMDDAPGPTRWQVFAGTFYGIICLMNILFGSVFLLFGVRTLMGLEHDEPKDGSYLVCISVVCAFAAFMSFRMCRRSFAGLKNTNTPKLTEK